MPIRHILLFGGAVALSVLVAGCGDDAPATAARTGGSPATTDAPTTTATHTEADDHDEEADHDAASGDADVIEVEMVEFGFESGPFEVPAGEPVTFRFTNTGSVAHEAMFGDTHQQEEFAQMGDGHDHGDGHHGDVKAITVEPGETGTLTVTLEPGETLMGCHLPGHFDAGMVSPVVAN